MLNVFVLGLSSLMEYWLTSHIFELLFNTFYSSLSLILATLWVNGSAGLKLLVIICAWSLGNYQLVIKSKSQWTLSKLGIYKFNQCRLMCQLYARISFGCLYNELCVLVVMMWFCDHRFIADLKLKCSWWKTVYWPPMYKIGYRCPALKTHFIIHDKIDILSSFFKIIYDWESICVWVQ